MRRDHVAAATFLMAGVLVGCTASSPSISPSTTASPSPPASVPASTGAAVFMPPTVATFEPSAGPGSEAWDVVALGDSNVAGWGIRDDEPFTPAEAFPGVYAASLADERGVTVTLHSYYPDQLGNEICTIAEWTDVLARDPTMRADLGQAEVVVVLVGFHNLFKVFLSDGCPGPWPDPMQSCLQGFTGRMPADFAELYAAIATLVPDTATVLVLDYGSTPQAYSLWGDDPNWPAIRQAMFGDWQDGLRSAATDAGFRVVHMSTALIHDDGAPRYDVYEITSDGLHFNAAGHRILADQCLLDDGSPE